MCTYPSGRRHPQLVVDEPAAAVWAVQMNTVTFHPWPVRTERHRQPRRAAHRPRPAAGRATFADAVEAALALREVLAEIGLTGWAKTSGNRGVHVYARVAPDPRVPRRAPRRHRHRPRARAPAARPRHHLLVEGGARRAGLRRLQPGLPRPHHRVGLQPAPAARRAGVVCRSAGTRCERRPRATSPCARVPGILAADGDAWAGIDDAVGDVAAAIALWDKDVHERGLGELQLPAGLPEDARRAAAGAAEQAPQGQGRRGLPGAQGRARRRVRACAGRAAGRRRCWPSRSRASPTASFCFEPKWDGFRSIVFRSGDQVEIGSRNEKPMTRYFPEVVEAVLANLPEKCVVDGEIVVVGRVGRPARLRRCCSSGSTRRPAG